MKIISIFIQFRFFCIFANIHRLPYVLKTHFDNIIVKLFSFSYVFVTASVGPRVSPSWLCSCLLFPVPSLPRLPDLAVCIFINHPLNCLPICMLIVSIKKTLLALNFVEVLGHSDYSFTHFSAGSSESRLAACNGIRQWIVFPVVVYIRLCNQFHDLQPRSSGLCPSCHTTEVDNLVVTRPP